MNKLCEYVAGSGIPIGVFAKVNKKGDIFSLHLASNGPLFPLPVDSPRSDLI